MAEYFPLLDRAVSGLTEQTAEARRSIYDRARTALLGQLRGMDPPISDDDIARESTALDEAIARVEARFAEHKTASPAKAPRAQIAPPRPAARPPAPVTAAEAATGSGAAAAKATAPRPGASSTPSPAGVAPPSARDRLGPAPGAAREAAPPRPSATPRPARTPAAEAAAPPAAASGLPPAGGLPGARGTRPVMPLRPVAASSPDAPASPSPELGRTTDGSIESGRDDTADARDDAGVAAPTEETGWHLDGIPPVSGRGRDGAFHPAAPRAEVPRRFSRPMIFGIALVAVLMIGIGIVAWTVRTKPEQVVAAEPGVEASTSLPAGKIVERAAPAAADASSSDAQATDAQSGNAPRIPQSGSDAAVPGIAVSQRAALLVDAPEEPQRVRTYTGTVVWHADSVSPGQGQPLSMAVKADVDIPEAKLKVTMLLQRNPEPQLPASHTIEFHFLPQAGYALGNVKQVNVPEMRRDDDAQTGDALTGVPVTITDNYFLVGLSRGAAEAQNLRLLTERNWLDMSVLFAPNKLGKLTFEKGAAGQRIVEDALASWKDNH